MPLGSFISSNPRVVTLVDVASFLILFDNKVQKLNDHNNTYMPSTKFTSGFHIYTYLNMAKSNHELIKGFFIQALVQ
ncbi:hydroperoxide dehydratase [Vigna unguiculata]|uniref:Hydroperoxide dehydratase n=1 Tax=Vigna unguiculata TaxID=3917 RepID=A0A4D6M275_VIGUN|nr:hydroperoxide dehydratase [Vigna unguiculata]